MIEEQNNNKVKDGLGNSTKPLLSSRLFKFRAWNGKEMLKDIIPMTNYAITRVQGLENTTSYCYYVPVEKIMQFTGLKDRNDAEIYEDDIVEMWGTKQVVKWQNYDNYQGFDIETDDNDIVVLGNIHQNPELL